MTRWHSPNLDIRRNAVVMEEIVKLVRRRQVRSIGMTEQILGCPHEEGIDYPAGNVCPQCPFWAGRPRPIFDDGDVDDTEKSTPRLPDRRAMEKTLASIGPNRSQGMPLEQAQEIMWALGMNRTPGGASTSRGKRCVFQTIAQMPSFCLPKKRLRVSMKQQRSTRKAFVQASVHWARRPLLKMLGISGASWKPVHI
jgi:hypothetical protein